MPGRFDNTPNKNLKNPSAIDNPSGTQKILNRRKDKDLKFENKDKSNIRNEK